MPNISLTPQMQAYVDRLVEAGVYGNASEVMRAGLRRLMEDDGAVAFELLRRDIAAAFAEEPVEVDIRDRLGLPPRGDGTDVAAE